MHLVEVQLLLAIMNEGRGSVSVQWWAIQVTFKLKKKKERQNH